MTATDRTPPPLKWLCLGNRDANDGFELFAHGIYARNGALVGSKLSLRERRQRVDLSAFLSGAPPLLAEAAVKHLLARLLCVHRHNTDLELLGKNFIPLHASSLGNAGVCERILASARQLQQHQVELCLLLAIDEQEPASAEYLASSPGYATAACASRCTRNASIPTLASASPRSTPASAITWAWTRACLPRPADA